MMPDDLGTKVCEAFDAFAHAPKVRGSETWDAFIEHVFLTVLDGDKVRAFDALLWILENKKNYVYQNVAGRLLMRFDIPCKAGIDDFMKIVLRNFDASARETVGYMVRAFGKETVKARVRALQSAELTKDERATVDTLRYWLGEHPRQA